MKLHARDMTPKNIIKYLHIDDMTDEYNAPLSINPRTKKRLIKQKQS